MNPVRPTADRRQARELVQDAILDVAERLAGIDGAASLSLKRLAEEAGVSTMVIYSRFGDRYGLEEALARRAVESLTDQLRASGPAGATGLSELGQAFRAWSLSWSSRFSLLFVTSHLFDSALRPEIDDAILRTGRTIEEQLGWRAGTGLTALAALVGYLTLELRQQVPGNATEAGYADLLVALRGLATA